MKRFVVMTYSPKLGGKARQYSGNYCGIRVVETTDGHRPTSVNAKTVVRVVEEWGALPMGKTAKSRGQQALAEARALAEKLNAVEEWRTECVSKDEAEDHAEATLDYCSRLLGV